MKLTRSEMFHTRLRPNREGKSICGTCQEVKELSEFLPDVRGRLGVSNRCRSCHRTATQDSRRRVATGWTAEEYAAAHEAQGGLCAICEQPEREGRMLSADHCHNTGKKRGLLCANCNLGLGNFKDNIETMKAAIRYMEGTA